MAQFAVAFGAFVVDREGVVKIDIIPICDNMALRTLAGEMIAGCVFGVAGDAVGGVGELVVKGDGFPVVDDVAVGALAFKMVLWHIREMAGLTVCHDQHGMLKGDCLPIFGDVAGAAEFPELPGVGIVFDMTGDAFGFLVLEGGEGEVGGMAVGAGQGDMGAGELEGG